MVKAATAVCFAVGLLLVGYGSDLIDDKTKVWLVVAGVALLVFGSLLWLGRAVRSRWSIVRRAQVRPPPRAAGRPTPQQDHAKVPTRAPLIQAIEEHAARLGDMLDARAAESPGPSGGLAEIVANREAFDAAAPAREEHDRRTQAIYFEQFRTPGLPLFDEAVDVWWAGNPKLRGLVEKPATPADLRKVEAIFRGLATNLREKETDKAMEARGFVKQYVAVDPKD